MAQRVRVAAPRAGLAMAMKTEQVALAIPARLRNPPVTRVALRLKKAREPAPMAEWNRKWERRVR